MINIAIDAMGGDNGVSVTVPAAVLAIKKYPDLKLTLVGDKESINGVLKNHHSHCDLSRLDIIHTSQAVTMDESPSVALRTKKDSSMRVALNLIKDGSVSACVSAGNTGALMATSKFVLKTLPEIDRPAIVYALPSINHETGETQPVYMLDLGANVGCSSEQLFQFAVMGSVLVSSLSNTKRARVALLNIGEEEMKGVDSIKQAAKMLYACDEINYIGYIEANDIFKAKADVIVCDGFVGNISLKTTEGVASFLGKTIKDAFNSNIFTRICYILSAPVLSKIKKVFDMSNYNGASLLGLRGIVIKSHGSAKAIAFATAIDEAVVEIKNDIPNKIQSQVEVLMQQQES